LLKENQPILETCKNKPELLLIKKTSPNEKAENLKNAAAKKGICFSELNDKTKLANQRRFCFFRRVAQRLALPASGRAWILFESRKNLKPENYRKKPQNPTCRVHALLACVLLCQTLWL